jgi:hypothetical protein
MASKKCSAKTHVDLFGEDGAPVPVPVHNITSSKKLKKGPFKYLKENGSLQTYHQFVCGECYGKALNESTTENYLRRIV